MIMGVGLWVVFVMVAMEERRVRLMSAGVAFREVEWEQVCFQSARWRASWTVGLWGWAGVWGVGR